MVDDEFTWSRSSISTRTASRLHLYSEILRHVCNNYMQTSFLYELLGGLKIHAPSSYVCGNNNFFRCYFFCVFFLSRCVIDQFNVIIFHRFLDILLNNLYCSDVWAYKKNRSIQINHFFASFNYFFHPSFMIEHKIPRINYQFSLKSWWNLNYYSIICFFEKLPRRLRA